MFKPDDIVKVLIPNAVNMGYDYRLTAPAVVGAFVRVSVMNRPYVGVIIGAGDSNLPMDKIKPVQQIFDFPPILEGDLIWVVKMSAWTMMPMGAVLRLIINVPDAFLPPKTEILYAFNFNEKARITDARQAVMDCFASNDNEPMSDADIQNIARVSAGVIRTMIKNNILIEKDTRDILPKNKPVDNYFDTGNITLNDEQKSAADEIAKHISADFSVHLLDGITGSGKTQVYFDSVIRAYLAGKSVLLMMPEIALTTQFITRFADKFGAPPVVWHSNLTSARRRDIWQGVARGDIKIIVGTRSALFLPFQNLGLIIIDEEHDGSYKQIDMGNYHARDMAILRASINKFPVVLASATPSAETVKNIQSGRYKHLKLTSRFGGAEIPKIETIDTRVQKSSDYILGDKKITGNISDFLSGEIEKTLAQKQQVMLFINRRGFAPIVQCKKCGWSAQCPDCSVGQTLHKKARKLLCHICGRTDPVPDTCPVCENEISVRGIGLEKVQEEVMAKFPNAKTVLVSSDTMMSRQSLERMVAQMDSGEIDIVIGTQILAKGHHFPNLTLVGVVDSDMGLFGADFRSGEHTFQQLFQVAGRAGRGDKAGRVMLQTYQPDHPVLTAICAYDRDGFMKADMDSRRAAKMPPYGQLIAVIVESTDEIVLQRYCAALSVAVPNLTGAKIMGPIQAQIYQIRTWYRMRFLVSGDERANLQPVVSKWLSRIKQPSNVRVKIDVNPQNFI